MLYILLVIGVILLALWLLGLILSFTLGGIIHILLAIGVICIIVWIVMFFVKRSK